MNVELFRKAVAAAAKDTSQYDWRRVPRTDICIGRHGLMCRNLDEQRGYAEEMGLTVLELTIREYLAAVRDLEQAEGSHDRN